MGHEVVSTWLDEVAKPEGMEEREFHRTLAIKDIAEVFSADCIILDLDEPSTTGGRSVEWGVALAPRQAKLKYVVGLNRYGVFYQLADQQFTNWDQLFTYFETHHRRSE